MKNTSSEEMNLLERLKNKKCLTLKNKDFIIEIEYDEKSECYREVNTGWFNIDLESLYDIATNKNKEGWSLK
jgi:hypothetical protein